MKTMNYSLVRILFALVIGLVLVLCPNNKLPIPSIGKRGADSCSDLFRPKKLKRLMTPGIKKATPIVMTI